MECSCTGDRKCHRIHPICYCCDEPMNAISVHTRSMWRYECPGVNTISQEFMCYKKMKKMLLNLEDKDLVIYK